MLDFLSPLTLPFYHIQLSLNELKNSVPLNAEFEEYPWEQPLLEPINAGCLAFIIQTTQIQLMIKTFPRMFHSPKSIYRANRKYLYLPIENNLMPEYVYEKTVQEIFSMREMDIMPDIVFAKILDGRNKTSKQLNIFNVSDAEEEIVMELITHKYVGTNKQDRVSLNLWNDRVGFFHDGNLYPDKKSNLMGKKLVVTGLSYEPLTVIDWNKEPQTYDGLDLQFMFQWAEKINFTYEFMHDENFYGEIWPNGSGNGALGFTSMDLADYVFVATCIWEYEHNFLDYSTTYFQSSVILVSPKPKLLPGWLVPVLPFSHGMWIAVVVSVFVCTTILYATSVASMKVLGSGTGEAVANMYSTWIECLFRTSGLLVLQVPSDERDWSTPRYVPMRHLVTWLILFYFVVTTAYSGGLATVLTVPRYEKPIDTVHDLASRDAKWTGIYDAYLVSIKDSVNRDIQQVVKNWRFDSLQWLKSKTTTGDMSFALEKMLGGHFFIPPFIDEDAMDHLRIMKEDLYTCVCVYVTRKGSPLMPSLNKWLMRARDAGLFHYWENLMVRTHLSSRRQLSVINSRMQYDDGPQKLQIHHIV
ncbi:hypothetical protein L9F63_010318, partial [Diploptera punctata]